MENSHYNTKVGFVAIIGRPNVGKSTLLNRFVGQKIAITSSKPQTTRNHIQGILTIPKKAQIIFVDTPGIHKPHHLFGEQLIKRAIKPIKEVDLILFMVDGTIPPGGGDRYVADLIKNSNTPSFLLLNKIDRLSKGERNKYIQNYEDLANFKKTFLISAKHGDNVLELLNTIIENLPLGYFLYDEDELTDQPQRIIVGELIREQVFRLTGEELPHSTAIVVEEMKERSNGIIYISAIIVVEKESQKGMIIGKNGNKLKEIGTQSRKNIEEFLNSKVYLELFVKLIKNWRKDPSQLRNLGYLD